MYAAAHKQSSLNCPLPLSPGDDKKLKVMECTQCRQCKEESAGRNLETKGHIVCFFGCKRIWCFMFIVEEEFTNGDFLEVF